MVKNSELMKGKRGVILGVANNRSIAWGIAKACHAAGAEIALTWQGDALKKRVEPLAAELGGLLLGHCDVTDPTTIDAVFDVLKQQWGKIDFVVHAIAFSDKDQLDGRYLETTADNFTKTLLISCYSLTAIAQRAGASERGRRAPNSQPDGQRILHRPGVDALSVQRSAMLTRPINLRVGANFQQQVKLLGKKRIVVIQVETEEREGLDKGAAAGNNLCPSLRDQIQGCKLLKDAHRVGRTQHGNCAGKADALGERRARGEDYRRGGIEKLGPVMFANPKHIEPHLVGERNLFQQVPHALRGAEHDPCNRVWNRCCKAVYTKLQG